MTNRPIRILELRSVFGAGGGPEKTILTGAARADRRRFEVTVCYLRDRRDPVFALDDVARALKVDYVEVIEQHSFDPAIVRQLRALIGARQIDIVHSHEYKTDFLALLLTRSTGVVPLSTVHGWSGYSWRERLLYYPLDRRLLARFPRVIAVSTSIRDRLIRSGVRAGRITTVLNGIDAGAFSRDGHRVSAGRAALHLPSGAVVAGAVGRLEREKRYDVLIEAVARLRAGGMNLHVVFAGTGSLAPELQKLAAQRGIIDACVFAGHCGDIKTVYHALDVFVQSSDTEGTPNAVLEAMALEVPVVATNVGGTGDLITDGVHGLLVPRRDPEALAQAIARTLADRTAARERVSAGRARVEQHLSFDARMRAVERIYEELFETVHPGARSVPVVA